MCSLYILRTSSNRLYIGVTETLINASRHTTLAKELNGLNPRSARIVYSERHPGLVSARKRELQLKKWSRAKKEALIVGDLITLKKFSRRKSLLGSR
jgi:putative endonuclease